MKEWHKVGEEQKRQNTARQRRYKEEKAEWEAKKKKVVAQKKLFRVPALKLEKCLGLGVGKYTFKHVCATPANFGLKMVNVFLICF
jgi:hypothetical protein